METNNKPILAKHCMICQLVYSEIDEAYMLAKDYVKLYPDHKLTSSLCSNPACHYELALVSSGEDESLLEDLIKDFQPGGGRK